MKKLITYKCVPCEKEFMDPGSFKEHLIQKHQIMNDAFECKRSTFSDGQSFHIQEFEFHRADKDYVCIKTVEFFDD